MEKSKKSKWYYLKEDLNFIEFYHGDNTNDYYYEGPFNSFEEAQADVLELFEAYKRKIQASIKEIKKIKPTEKFYDEMKGTYEKQD